MNLNFDYSKNGVYWVRLLIFILLFALTIIIVIATELIPYDPMGIIAGISFLGFLILVGFAIDRIKSAIERNRNEPIYVCPQCRRQINRGISYCPHCYTGLRWIH